MRRMVNTQGVAAPWTDSTGIPRDRSGPKRDGVCYSRLGTTSIFDGFEVVVCGGGIAGMEALLRMRRLVGQRVSITLLDPGETFSYRPLAVREPFGFPRPRRYPLRQITADLGIRWVQQRLSDVAVASATVCTERGDMLHYDALLVATGARESSAYPGVYTFSDRTVDEADRIVRAVSSGDVNSVAFVLAADWGWPLPLYELALMTAHRARSLGRRPRLVFITAEPRPLKAFGRLMSEAVAHALATADIELHTGVVAHVPHAHAVMVEDKRVEVEQIVSLPKITGPALRGLPAGTRWFVATDSRCVVPSTGGRVFAAGDATDFPVKHGAIAAQQADVAAAGIAHLAGLAERPPPLRPVIRGSLLTGQQPLYATAELSEGLGWRSTIYEHPPWPLDEKVIADELGPYLRALERRITLWPPTVRTATAT
jgi:sulfide:quinone oxidoreductase